MNLLSEAGDSNLIARKWNIALDQSNAKCSVGSEIIDSTEVLKSNLYYYNYIYVLVRGEITIIGRDLATEVAFENCAPFISGSTLVDQQ